MKSFVFVVSGSILILLSNPHMAAASANALTNSLPSFSDIARSSDGSISYMTQMEAVTYCNAQGMHLPNAKELAQLATYFGSQGILEVDDIGPGKKYESESDAIAAGYYKFHPIDENPFYFNDNGYKRPAGDLGQNWFWSSSIGSWYYDYFFALDGSAGHLYFSKFGNDQTRQHSVRCVSGQ